MYDCLNHYDRFLKSIFFKPAFLGQTGCVSSTIQHNPAKGQWYVRLNLRVLELVHEHVLIADFIQPMVYSYLHNMHIGVHNYHELI